MTVAALTTGGNTDQLVFHLGLAKENGATEEELIEAITHLALLRWLAESYVCYGRRQAGLPRRHRLKGDHHARSCPPRPRRCSPRSA